MALTAPSDDGSKSPAHVRRVFSRVAARYDLVNTLTSLGIDRAWRRAAVKAAGLSGRERADVLDVCAGTGELTLALAGAMPSGRLIGLDISPEMLTMAGSKAPQGRLQVRPTFVAADALGLPFPDRTFDVVTVGFGVRNLPDRAKAFAEAARVLRPGGRYVVLEFSRPPQWIVRALYHTYLRTVVPAIGGLLTGDVSSYSYLRRTILAFPGPGELGAEIAAAGFEVTWKQLSGGIVALHVGVRRVVGGALPDFVHA